MLIGFGATKLPDNVSQGIILGGAEIGSVSSDDVVDGEDVRHFDVQCRFSLGVEVIELVNVELRLGIWDSND